ncbi:DNA-3-methyladenine glycosylase [Pedobacter nototheniae]|uniref:DNA-3-methyladenine glycosylase n=1 Tax=Pedobacter nototheniae TaxID=2488994 RepID=UPI002930B968|nr:DNA-3-methyladenine glycosylase [Pedobacter nototheniae]
MKLKPEFYLNDDVVALAKDLLGKILYTQINGEVTSGIIVETEAYFGVKDKASHAYGGRRTNRTEVMFGEGGKAYVYLCYGIHYLFNITTSVLGDPHAVLVRAIQPLDGLEIIEERRNMPVSKPAVSSGPGSAAKALGINLSFNTKDLTGMEIWIEDHQITYKEEEIAAGPRVGIAYAKEHALLPWRFFVKGNKYVSKPNKV